LIPGQFEQIAAHLQLSLEEAKKFFWASAGAIVMDLDANRQYRIGTITPRYDKKKHACVFLTDEGFCRVHAVAPYGCSHFDTHMSAQEGHRRSVWGLHQIVANAAYSALRKTLSIAESWKPKGY
jgi:Fe-S-cluster containining protein